MVRQVVTLGEIMMRLKAPGHERLLQTPHLEATFGGGESNVAVSLAAFGENVHHVTRLPDNALGRACRAEMRRFGVATDYMSDGPGRMGLYFLEAGANQRASTVLYDRVDSAMALAKPGDLPWDQIFENADWFHFSGITPALSKRAAALTLEAVKAAVDRGVTVSCDFNHRAKLWRYGKTAPEVMNQLMPYVDVGIAGRDDCRKCLGPEFAVEETGSHWDPDAYAALTLKVLRTFPHMQQMAVTLRESITADHHRWSACLRNQDGFHTCRTYEITRIVDRVGAGDAFSAGLIYGLHHFDDPGSALAFATAAGCLKHSVPGDVNRVSVAEVMHLMDGEGSARVQR
ncbi:sugar kinase [Acanthopleuribacter pedis]|uniref:Sugar kinase n=1 Tax=Acanthopleuribacter pedis TaxID=442870 RepID=A0A8J7QJD3_9BACT|nr:sugar kinase [Acanthopleuribacter pedis]MBO1321911.1 sugar kinase [Acanthopleuribacter pedis]